MSDQTGDVDLVLAGQRLVLLPERAAWWPARRALLVADVHLGKDHTFRSYGIAVPRGSSTGDLASLERLVLDHGARELWVLGDLFHSADVAALDQDVRRWCAALKSCEVLLVHGNHDRRLALNPGWPIRSLRDTRVDGVMLRHEPRSEPDGAEIAGHVHPAVRLGTGRGDRLRAPAFWLRGEQLVLPAYGSFTGGHTITPDAGERVFAVGPGAVLEVITRAVAT